MNDFASKMMSVDRRILYAVLLGIILFGLLIPVNLPLTKAAPAQKLFEAVEAAPTDKIAFVSTAWTNSTRGENAPQMAALMRHLMRRKIKFALIQFGNPEAVVLAQLLAEDVTKEDPEYKDGYGKTWINLGFKQDMLGTLKAMRVDIPAVYRDDFRDRRRVTDFEITRNLKTIKDVGIVVEVAPSGTYKYWIQLIQGGDKIPYGLAATSVMVPELYPYLDSGQMVGMLFGLKGAAEYEDLLQLPADKKESTRFLSPLSLSLIYLFLLIFLGNLGMYLSRRREEGQA